MSSTPAGSSVDAAGTSDGHTSPLLTSPGENQQDLRGRPEVKEEILDEVHHQMCSCIKGPVQKDDLRWAIQESGVVQENLVRFFQAFNSRNSKEANGGNFSFPRRFSPVVKVFVHVTGTTCGADQVILKKVQSLSLTLKRTEDWSQSDVFLVFCPITTRPGADVHAAMMKLQGDKPVLLVVMYHTLDEEHSADLRRWSNSYKNVVFDVDVLFHETTPGLLKCPRNDAAIKQIEKTLKKYSKHFRSS